MRKLLLTLAVLCGTVSAWAESVKYDAGTTPSLPGTSKTTEFTGQNYNQYHFTSQKFTAPADFKTLRLTFLANSNNESPAGYPCVAISEFYLYDKDGNKVTLTASNFSSNATLNDATEGSVDALFDGIVSGDINTYKWYWHSEWKTNVGDYHYMEINVAEITADLSEFSFGYVTRRENGSPSEMLVTTGSSTEDVARQYGWYMLFNKYDLSTQAFRIKNSNITSEDLYMTIETPNSTDQNEGGVKILAKSKNNGSQAFKFEQQSDGTFYIKSESGYYLNTLSSWGFNAVSEPVTSENRSNFTITYIGNDEFRIRGAKGLIGPNDAYTTNHPYELFSNHGTDKQYIDWILEPYSTEYTVTYNYKVGDEVMLTEEHIIVGDNDYPAVKSFYGVSIAETAPAGKVTEDGTFNFTCTVDDTKFPFAYAPDVESIEKWQYIQMHSNNKKFLKYESTYISWSDANLPELGKTDAYAWTFVGNPFVGFKMLNKAATTAKALRSTNGGNPVMANYAEATSFLAAASNQTGTGYFCMRYPGGNYLNAQNGKLAHWSSNDAGSTMVVNGDFVEITLAEYLADLKTLISNAEEFVTTNDANKSKVGYYKLTDIQAQIDNAQNYTESESIDDVDIAFLDLQDVMNNPEVNLPVDGRFYRIENNNASGYLSSGTGTGRTLFVAGIGDQASSIFCYTGGKLLSYTTGLYLAKTGDMLGYTNTVGEVAGTTIGFTKSPVLGKLLISFDNGNRSFYSDAVGDSNGASAGQTGEHYRFTVTEVESLPVPMNVEAGYSTLYSPVALSTYRYESTDAHRVEAYTGVIDGEKLSLTRIDAEDGIIPANTPVVLKYVADIENGNVFLQVSDSEKAAIESDLKGTLADTYITDNSYVLSRIDGVVAFYKATMNQLENTAFLNNGFKAYLPKSENTPDETRFFVFNFGDDTETAIEGIEAENTADAAVYDLAGRRVQKAQKGLYIVNGKKVIK